MEIKIYLANLGKYNEGELVGDWFTLPVDLEEAFVKIGVAEYDENGEYSHGKAEGEYYYEEWAIHDYEAPFSISEYTSLTKLNEIAERLEGVDGDELEMLLECCTFDEAIERLENGSYSVYSNCKNEYDLGWELAIQGGYVDTDSNSILHRYFDYESFGRDCILEGNYHFISNDMCIELHY